MNPLSTYPETLHARTRGAQRAIDHDRRQLVAIYGRRYYADGYTYCFFGNREAERYRGELGPLVDRLTSVLVIIEPMAGSVITAYRNPQALHRVRRRSLPFLTTAENRATLRLLGRKQ